MTDPEVVAARAMEIARKVAEATANVGRRSDAERARLLLGVRSAVVAAGVRHRRFMMSLVVTPIALVLAGVVFFGTNLWQRRAVRLAPQLSAQQWQEVDLGPAARLRILRGTDYFVPRVDDLPAAQGIEVDLREGTLCAQVSHRDAAREGPFVVRAPGLSVWDVGTDFCVSSERGISTVGVNEGVVRVERPAGRGVEVRAGEWVRSDDARLLAQELPTATPAIEVAEAAAPADVPNPRRASSRHALALPPAGESDCETGAVATQRACYEARAAGNTVAAQTALYSLAFLDARELHDSAASVSDLRRYQARFSGGFLAPEVSFSLIDQLSQQGETEAAEREARAFLASFPGHPRADEVALWLGDLLAELNRPAEAEEAYARCLEGPLRVQAQSRLAEIRRQQGIEETNP